MIEPSSLRSNKSITLKSNSLLSRTLSSWHDWMVADLSAQSQL